MILPYDDVSKQSSPDNPVIAIMSNEPDHRSIRGSTNEQEGVKTPLKGNIACNGIAHLVHARLVMLNTFLVMSTRNIQQLTMEKRT